MQKFTCLHCGSESLVTPDRPRCAACGFGNGIVEEQPDNQKKPEEKKSVQGGENS
jgi:ribosomal protein L37E